jgi:hypothetical protein
VREPIIHAIATKLEQALGEEHECLFSGSEGTTRGPSHCLMDP